MFKLQSTFNDFNQGVNLINYLKVRATLGCVEDVLRVVYLAQHVQGTSHVPERLAYYVVNRGSVRGVCFKVSSNYYLKVRATLGCVEDVLRVVYLAKHVQGTSQQGTGMPSGSLGAHCGG